MESWKPCKKLQSLNINRFRAQLIHSGSPRKAEAGLECDGEQPGVGSPLRPVACDIDQGLPEAGQQHAVAMSA